MRNIYIFILLLSSIYSKAQKRGGTFSFDKVMDPQYGINVYDKLNFVIGGDSVRKCGGYACKQAIKDYYETGDLLHYGYYIDGQLRNYKNYYPNGQLEREFRTIDDIRSTMKIYYSNGQLKSSVKYVKGIAQLWQDFYPDGTLEFYEEYNRKVDYVISQKMFYEGGIPQSILELVNKKQLLYDKKEYYPNGQIKASGQLVYNIDMLDYQKVGLWTKFDSKGRSKSKEAF